MSALARLIDRHRADASMSVIVLIWGFHFVVIKDGLSDLDPLAFNAIRFAIGAPFMLLLAILNPELRRVTRRDIGILLLLTITGAVAYQVFMILGLSYTTSTNSALLIATMPTWTAVLSIVFSDVIVHRRLVMGIAITLVGVVLVVLGKNGSELSISSDDLIGSGLSLAAAVALAANNLAKKPVLDRLGGTRVAVWMYWFTALCLVILAVPEFAQMSPSDVPVSVLPNLFYSGLLAGVGGFITFNYAIKTLGPTRASTYFNINPLIAAVAGILVLGEPLTVALIVGGLLTFVGVFTVRHNIYTRTPPA